LIHENKDEGYFDYLTTESDSDIDDLIISETIELTDLVVEPPVSIFQENPSPFNSIINNNTQINNVNNIRTGANLKEEYSVCFFNTRGAQKNQYYVNRLIEKTQILFLSETLTTKHKKLTNTIYVKEKIIYSCEATKNPNKRGRPEGGIAFIISKDIRASVEFITNRIGILRLLDHPLLIIGVYLPSSGSEDSDEEYQVQLGILESIKFSNPSTSIMIGGDYNYEFRKIRTTNADKTQRKLMIERSLINYGYMQLDCLYLNYCQYTYRQQVKPKRNRVRGKSRIDAILFSGDLHIFNQINILFPENQYDNNSDHNAIEALIELKVIPQKPRIITNCKIVKRFNWKDLEFVLLYNRRLMNEIEKARINRILDLSIEPTEDLRANLSYLANNIHSCQQLAYNSAVNTILKRVKKKNSKSAQWWTDEVELLYREYRKQNKLFLECSPSRTVRKKILKKNKNIAYDQFRRCQRLNKELIEKRKFVKLESEFCRNRIDGWKLFKRMYRENNCLNATAEQVKVEFEKHFTQKIAPDSPSLQIHKEIVENFTREQINKTYQHEVITLDELENVLFSLPNGKKAGMSGSPYELFKYGTNVYVNQNLCNIFNTILREGKLPYLFNITIITARVATQYGVFEKP